MDKKKKIAIFDVDDTLIPFTEAICAKLEKKFNKPFDFNQVAWGFGHLSEDERKYAVSLFEDAKFIKSIKFPEETIKMLKMAAEELEYDLIFCTSTYTKVMTTRGLYLQDNTPFIPAKNCIMTGRKDVVQGDVSFDDNIDHVKNAITNVPVLITKPWNKGYTGFIRANTIEEYIDILIRVKEGWSKQDIYEYQNPKKETRGPVIISIMNCGSGSGKTVVVNKLLEISDAFERVVTYTTRTPRPGEINGKDYYFVTKKEFRALIKKGELLEYTIYAGNYYGTTKSNVQKILDSGKNAVIIITSDGADAIKREFPNISYNVGIVRDKAMLIKAILDRDVPEQDKLNRIIQLEDDLKDLKKSDYCINNIDILKTAQHIEEIFK